MLSLLFLTAAAALSTAFGVLKLGSFAKDSRSGVPIIYPKALAMEYLDPGPSTLPAPDEGSHARWSLLEPCDSLAL